VTADELLEVVRARRTLPIPEERRATGGFETKTEAREALKETIDQPTIRRDLTVQMLVDEYLDQHIAEENTIATLTHLLKHATRSLGDLELDRLRVAELRAWRKRLPERSAWHIVKALRQVLNYAVECGYLAENIARKVPNPEPKRAEVETFETVEVDASRRSSARRCRSSSPGRACARRSGSRSSGETSTSRRN
jgi:hypothetical protein